MRKQVLLSCIFLLLGTTLMAQITGADMPVIGGHYNYKNINKNGFDTYPTTVGIGVEWNYINIVEKTDSVVLDYIDPATTSEGAGFPASTIAEATAGAVGHFFYKQDTATFYREGFYQDDAGTILNIPYTDDLKLYELPFEFGTSFGDTYTCDTGGFAGYPALIDNGDYNSDVQGSGTLRLPTGYFNNVFRIYYEETFTIKADIGFGYMGMISVDEFGYEYWKAGHEKPLLTYYSTTTNDLLGGSSQTDIGVRYDKFATPDGSNPTGITENLTDAFINIYPNPSSGQVFIDLRNFAGISTLEVVDITGQVVYQEKINGLSSVNLDNLSAGIYQLRFSAAGLSVNRTLVIQP
jgi:hypothetical protein